jgi:hypothetical protein
MTNLKSEETIDKKIIKLTAELDDILNKVDSFKTILRNINFWSKEREFKVMSEAKEAAKDSLYKIEKAIENISMTVNLYIEPSNNKNIEG